MINPRDVNRNARRLIEAARRKRGVDGGEVLEPAAFVATQASGQRVFFGKCAYRLLGGTGFTCGGGDGPE